MWVNLSDTVTFKAFRNLMAKRHYTVDDLVDLFHGELSENREFFTRVMRPNKALEDVVIPYRSVLEFYFKEKASQDMQKAIIG